MSNNEALAETNNNPPDAALNGLNNGEGAAENMPLKPLSQDPVGAGIDLDLDMLMEVPVTLSVEIGTNKMPIKELVSLNQGSIIDLDRDLSEPMSLLVNGTLIARGEVVVIGKRFGLRIVDILSPKDRLRNLK